ncbi:MAG: dTMP kinase [Nanoarchaeales archaeon]
MFIVIEGIDGCGKTRVIEELKKRLEEKGNKVFLTKEPFDNRIKELIKSIIKEEHPKNKYFGLFLACLFAADRYLHKILLLYLIDTIILHFHINPIMRTLIWNG